MKNSDVFSGRTVHPLLELLGKRPGLPGTDYGPRSKAYKKLILSVLKRYQNYCVPFSVKLGKLYGSHWKFCLTMYVAPIRNIYFSQ